MNTFEEANDHFRATYGFSLILRNEPTLMSRHKRPSQWVGAEPENVVLLRRTGYPPTRYPKSHGIITNGGYRLISLSTLLSNLKEGRQLFQKL
jgi:hypothetical protein